MVHDLLCPPYAASPDSGTDAGVGVSCNGAPAGDGVLCGTDDDEEVSCGAADDDGGKASCDGADDDGKVPCDGADDGGQVSCDDGDGACVSPDGDGEFVSLCVEPFTPLVSPTSPACPVSPLCSGGMRICSPGAGTVGTGAGGPTRTIALEALYVSV